jgi:chromosome segregation ATPase
MPNLPSTPMLTEMLRQGSESGKPENGDKDESKLPMFWRVFGGTVLSIAAMVLITAYQSLSGGMADTRHEMAAMSNEMHKEVARLAEVQGQLVKKEESATGMQAIWSSLRELQEDRKELTTIKERCDKLMAFHRGGEEQRRVLADQLQGLREQRVQQEERRALAADLAALRERLAGLEGKAEAGPGKVNQE